MMKTWKETSSSCRRVSSTSNTARKTISGGLKSLESVCRRKASPEERTSSPLREVSVVGGISGEERR